MPALAKAFAALFAFVVASVTSIIGATAHPHVFVDARAEIMFDRAGAIIAVRHIWQFDEAFTAFATQGLDTNNDGKLSDVELKPLAKVNVDSLKEYGFFTWLRQGRTSFPFVPPTEYRLELHGGQLTLFYTLPLKTPVTIRGRATLEVYDPEYFVAFTFPKKKAVTLTNAPAGCTGQYEPPHILDAKTMSMLAAIPADQHDLPPELQDAAAGLANLIAITCPGHPVGSAVDPFSAVTASGDSAPAVQASAPAAARATVPARPLPEATATDVPVVGDLTAADIAAAPVSGSDRLPAEHRRVEQAPIKSKDQLATTSAAAGPSPSVASISAPDAHAASIAAAPILHIRSEEEFDRPKRQPAADSLSPAVLMTAAALAIAIAVCSFFLLRIVRRT